MGKVFVYISSWNNFGGDPGMGLYQFSPETGEFCFVKMQCETVSCGVTYVDAGRNVLYVCNEVVELPGCCGGGGCVIAYQIQKDGTLTELNRGLTLCPNPAYAALTPDGTRMLVANHSGHGAVTKLVRGADGSFCYRLEYDDALVNLFEIQENGAIGKMLDAVEHVGHGVRPEQSHARPHCAVPSPLASLYAVCDKGNDSIYMYTVVQDRLRECARYEEALGSMPRYCVFHPTKPYMFVNYEGNMALTAFRYDASGCLKRINMAGADAGLEENHDRQCYEGQSLAIHPSGRYIYNMLKGPEMISVFQVEEDTGRLTLIQNKRVSRGVWLRGGAVSPDGKYLITACMKSGDVEVFRILDNGTLEPTGRILTQSAAAYVTFSEIPQTIQA